MRDQGGANWTWKLLLLNREGQRQQCFLFDFVGLGASRGWAGAGAALYAEHGTIARNAL